MSRAALSATVVPLLLLLGCASGYVSQDPPPDHPASPLATEGRTPLRSRVLAGTAHETSVSAPQSGGTPAELGHGGRPEAPHQEDSAPKTVSMYACPMHPEVTSDRPGTCPRCGMALVEQEGRP